MTMSESKHAPVVLPQITKTQVMLALELVPTDMSHQEKCQWIADALNKSAAPAPVAQPSQCAQCKKKYRHGSAVGCPKCAPGMVVPESEFREPIAAPAPVAQDDHETWRAELWELIDGYRKGHDWPLAMRGRIKAHIAKMPAPAPVPQPLTDKQIDQQRPPEHYGLTERWGFRDGVRFAEDAHGIDATGQEVQPAAGRTPAST
jgi:hypothetical protein